MPEPMTLIAFGTGLGGLGTHLARRYFNTAKDIVDILLGVLAFLICLPVMFLCAVIIKISSRGPLLYAQKRVGRGGKDFTMYKFRTMFIDAEHRSGAVWAQKNDPRVVPACRWMRKSHMDELPQIFNVIKGEMSLVGPRPERGEILAELQKTYPNVHDRLAVRPGITGLAQIRNGYDASVEGFAEKLRSDLEYIENRCWWLEFKILLKTFSKLNDKSAH